MREWGIQSGIFNSTNKTRRKRRCSTWPNIYLPIKSCRPYRGIEKNQKNPYLLHDRIYFAIACGLTGVICCKWTHSFCDSSWTMSQVETAWMTSSLSPVDDDLLPHNLAKPVSPTPNSSPSFKVCNSGLSLVSGRYSWRCVFDDGNKKK